MNLSLSPAEHAELLVLVEREHADIRAEIHHTETFSYKEVLKQREATLKEILEKLRSLSPAS